MQTCRLLALIPGTVIVIVVVVVVVSRRIGQYVVHVSEVTGGRQDPSGIGVVAAAAAIVRATAAAATTRRRMEGLLHQKQKRGRQRQRGHDQPQRAAVASRSGLAAAQSVQQKAGEQAGRATGGNERLCEAYFFVGEYYLLQGNKARAREMFGRAIETNAAELIEYKGARSELRRMGP